MQLTAAASGLRGCVCILVAATASRDQGRHTGAEAAGSLLGKMLWGKSEHPKSLQVGLETGPPASRVQAKGNVACPAEGRRGRLRWRAEQGGPKRRGCC